MNVHIRQERPEDYEAVSRLIKDAFKSEQMSDHQEHYLVSRLRQSEVFIPELSLVATQDNGLIVGHILLTQVGIETSSGTVPSLGVAPLSVLRRFQRQGIGGMLLRIAHIRALHLGYESSVLLGHKDYYPRFGYRKASDFGIRFPFDVPDEYCMVKELRPGALSGVQGLVRYSPLFFEGME